MVALVTGGSRGIGVEICRALAKDGYDIAINYNHSKENAENLATEIVSSYNVKALAVRCDVSDYNQITEMFSLVNSELGNVDVLVNNAGVSTQELITDVTPEHWQNIIGVNLNGAFYCSKKALPHMISQKQGVIINISSMWGQVGASCEVAYSTSKAGLIGFTKALAKEVAPSGIRVNSIAPGVIMTDMMAHYDNETINELKEETPLQTLGTPQDIANAVSFLVSKKASFITGQVLGVNGGFII